MDSNEETRHEGRLLAGAQLRARVYFAGIAKIRDYSQCNLHLARSCVNVLWACLTLLSSPEGRVTSTMNVCAGD